MIRIKNNSAKNVKFNAYLYSNGLLGRNYVSSTTRDEVFIDKNGVNLGNTQSGINYASAYPTISAYADGTWNYKFSDLTTATAGDMRPGFHPWVGTPLEKAMASHSSTLAWRIPWIEEPVGL